MHEDLSKTSVIAIAATNIAPHLGPLFFNIHLNDLFYFVDSKICNYADNTIFAASHDLNEIMSQLQQSLKCISEWFQIILF